MAEDPKKEDKREDLSKRGMKDGKYRSGSFKKAKKRGMKVVDLKMKQVKRGKAGGKKVTNKEAKAAQKNVVQISDTKFVKGEGVMGPNGKPLTGKVELASGKMAHYVRGRRVMAGGKGSGGGSGSGGSGSGGGGGGYRAKTAADKTGKSTYNPGGGTKKPTRTIIGKNKPLKKGEAPGRFQSKSRPSPRKIGDTRSVPYGTRTRKERWDGNKWVPVNRFGK